MRAIIKHSHERRVLAGGLGFVVLGALVASVAIATASNSRTPGARPRLKVIAASAEAGVTSQLAALSRPSVASDALPSGYAGSPSHWLPESRVGANAALARRISSSKGGAIYLIPSATGVCMVNTDGTQNICATPEELENGEAEEADLCSPGVSRSEIEIGGLLPDGTTDAHMVLADGSAVPLTLTGNSYAAGFSRTGSLPSEIAWTSSDGQPHSASANVPPSASTETCTSWR